MAVRLTKGEVEVIEAILTDDSYSSPDAMARAVLKTAYQLMCERDWYVAGWQEPPDGDRPVFNFLYGPYPYEKEALKALETGVAQGPTGAKRGVFKVYGIAAAEDRLARIDEDEQRLDPPCECGHRKSNHDVPGQKYKGCFAPAHICKCKEYRRESH